MKRQTAGTADAAPVVFFTPEGGRMLLDASVVYQKCFGHSNADASGPASLPRVGIALLPLVGAPRTIRRLGAGVVWHKSRVRTEGVAGRLQVGATPSHSSAMARRGNDAGADATTHEYNGTSATPHQVARELSIYRTTRSQPLWSPTGLRCPRPSGTERYPH